MRWLLALGAKWASWGSVLAHRCTRSPAWLPVRWGFYALTSETEGPGRRIWLRAPFGGLIRSRSVREMGLAVTGRGGAEATWNITIEAGEEPRGGQRIRNRKQVGTR